MCKVLAVSGGVDSMVMLSLAVREFPADELVVASFDHGTRESSKLDVDFVSHFSYALNSRFYRGDVRLGAKIGEEKAREKRYEFLREIAKREGGEIWTAHHLDDLVETVAINFLRGTGFRGLAVLNAAGVRRPFLDGTFGEVFDKQKILEYAAKNGVAFRQDPTNTSDDYLRNRVRPKVLAMSHEMKVRLFELWEKQKQIVRKVDETVESLLPEDLTFERKWFLELDDAVAMEILRAGLIKAGVSATRPQIKDFLEAIRNYDAGKKFNLPGDKLVKIGRRDFSLKM